MRIKFAELEKILEVTTVKPNYLDLHRDWTIGIFEWFDMNNFSSTFLTKYTRSNIFILQGKKLKWGKRKNNFIFTFL